MPVRTIVRQSSWALGAIALAWAFACKGPEKILGPIECADPCCGGNGQVDCEVNPDVDCIEDADICTALRYGCSNGSEYQGLVPPNRPLSCSNDGGLGDAVTTELPDGFGLLSAQLGDDGASSEASTEGGDGAMDAGNDETPP